MGILGIKGNAMCEALYLATLVGLVLGVLWLVMT